MTKPKKPAADRKAPDPQDQDALLDEALEETFPASDPIAPGEVDPPVPPKPKR